MSRLLAKLSLITAGLWFGAGPTSAVQAGLIVYSWSGFMEPGPNQFPTPNDWELSGDGEYFFTRTDGTPYTISVAVDSAAVEKAGNGADTAYFAPTWVDLLIDGNAATGFSYTGSDSGFRLLDNVLSGGLHDSIGFRGNMTFNGFTLTGGFDNQVDSNTFSLLPTVDTDVPIMFGTAALLNNFGTVTGDLATFGTLGGNVTSTAAVPEPGTLLLLGGALAGSLGLRSRRRKATAGQRDAQGLSVN